MGAGILPTTIYKNKLYFLFGKENKYADTPGFSDFGGGTDNGESYIQTAIREGGEELTGFLGSDEELGKMLKKRGTYNINNGYSNKKHGTYRMHIFNMNYDAALPRYYNNNQLFLQTKLDQEVIKKSKIFEKAEICWFCVDELLSRKKEFRNYFQAIIDKIIAQQAKIYKFIQKSQGHRNYSSVNEVEEEEDDDEDEDTSTTSTTTSNELDEDTSTTSSTSSSLDDTTTSTPYTTSSNKTHKLYENENGHRNGNKNKVWIKSLNKYRNKSKGKSKGKGKNGKKTVKLHHKIKIL
jgi:hypothetical protein